MFASHAQGQLLAQVRPSVVTPVTLFTASQLAAEITLITACIIAGGTSPTDIELYHDETGTTYDNTNIIVQSTRTALTQDTIIFQAQHPGSGIMLRPGDSLGGAALVTINNVVFSVYGITQAIAERMGSRNE